MGGFSDPADEEAEDRREGSWDRTWDDSREPHIYFISASLDKRLPELLCVWQSTVYVAFELLANAVDRS